MKSPLFALAKNQQEITLPLDYLEEGVYLIRVENENGVSVKRWQKI